MVEHQGEGNCGSDSIYLLQKIVKSVLESRLMANVVITGGSRGLGKAMARRFLEHGDRVIICSRSEESISEAIDELGTLGDLSGKSCDITDYKALQEFGKWVQEQFDGQIDYWINNAGVANPTKAYLDELPVDEIDFVIRTNLTGTILATKVALNLMKEQKEGHIFLMEGMGSTGRPSPRLLPYGASKASFPQLLKTLVEETKGSKIGVHSLSPGIVLTDLLLENAPLEAKRIFNILAELPETPAHFLVERIKAIKGTGKRIQFLTRRRAMWRFMTAWRYKNRYFDEVGNLVIKL